VTLAEREARLDALLAAEDATAVWLARPDSFAWATDGGDSRVDRTAAVGEAAVGYLGDGTWRVLTNDIEAERLAAEQLPPELSASVVGDPWHETGLAGAVAARTPEPALADFPVAGLSEFDPTRLRLRLSASDRERYRQLGSEVAAGVERVCRQLQPDDTEREVASALQVGLAGRGIDTPVVLVGGSERAPDYRHPTPTAGRLGSYALVAVTARRGGLYASLTRTVAFGDAPEWLPERHAAARRVETAAAAATRRVATHRSSPTDDTEPGRAGVVFDAIRAAYTDVGHPGEWTAHHQGGATGYAGREWIATPDSDAPVVSPAAYAWNPTVQGAKSEDTLLVEDGTVERLTATGEWPTTTVTVDELSLERPDVLRR
jgi:Xaa-Pro aminopeptidase